MTFHFRARACVVVAAIVSAFSCAANAVIPTTERDALIALYTNTNGASWTTHTGWNGAAGTECTWFGITCNATLSHVTEISLASNQLTGTIPSLTGLTNLAGFSAYNNQLTGTIPSLTSLTNLFNFDVGSNQLTGTIPSLTGLTNLGYFDVGSNQLTGTVPSLTGLTNLIGFSTDNNQLTGTIPDLTGLAVLGYLKVGANHLSGVLPAATNGLVPGGSSLCPNDFPESSYTDAPAWDAATGFTPWYTPCNLIFANGFEF